MIIFLLFDYARIPKIASRSRFGSIAGCSLVRLKLDVERIHSMNSKKHIYQESASGSQHDAFWLKRYLL